MVFLSLVSVHGFWMVGFNYILSSKILNKYLKEELLWPWCQLSLQVQCDNQWRRQNPITSFQV